MLAFTNDLWLSCWDAPSANRQAGWQRKSSTDPEGKGPEYSDSGGFVWPVTRAARFWFSMYHADSYIRILSAAPVKPVAGRAWNFCRLSPHQQLRPWPQHKKHETDFLITTHSVQVCAKTGKDSPVDLCTPTLSRHGATSSDHPPPEPVPVSR